MRGKLGHTFCLYIALHGLFASLLWAAANAPAGELERWLDHLEGIVPQSAESFAQLRVADVAEAAAAIDAHAASLSAAASSAPPAQKLETARRLLDAKRRADALLDQTLAARIGFAKISIDPNEREPIRRFLATAARLTDLSGRLRYQLSDMLGYAARSGAATPRHRRALMSLLIEHRSSIGATVIEREGSRAGLLADPSAAESFLMLVAASGQSAALPKVAEILQDLTMPPSVVLRAAETLRKVGLPQSPRPGTPRDLPQPAITPDALAIRLSGLPSAALSPADAARRDELLAWVRQRAERGVTEDAYRVAGAEIRPGDWLLMRNPSPYNLFTDLAPGLFTHVGVVAAEVGDDGVRRFVIVDLAEHGQTMPATNIEIFLERTLNYVFLRHDDPAAGRAMGEAARSVIGNPIEFDLTFRTSRVLPLAHQELEGRKIQTYCAGFLLLCALQTDHPRADFFPLTEVAAGGKTAENLKLLGLSVGDDFVSPTGALFSPHVQIVARREPMYDPRREIEEAAFDHFARCLAEKQLAPKGDWFNSLRVKLAEASRTNPLLAQALAQAANVSAEMDLVAAAKTAAVVETLDEIAFSAGDEFEAAREAILAGPIGSLARDGVGRDELAMIEQYRRTHAELHAALNAGRLSPRELRVALVRHAIETGRRQIDQQFFTADIETVESPRETK